MKRAKAGERYAEDNDGTDVNVIAYLDGYYRARARLLVVAQQRDTLIEELRRIDQSIRNELPDFVLLELDRVETLDTKGAAELLHVSEKLTARLAREGELPAVWLAGQWLFLRHELIVWLSEKARDEQRIRREQTLAMAEVEKPIRAAGRPRKVHLVG